MRIVYVVTAIAFVVAVYFIADDRRHVLLAIVVAALFLLFANGYIWLVVRARQEDQPRPKE